MRASGRENPDGYHEAGHAICAEVMGFPVLWLDLHPGEKRRGYCAHDDRKHGNHRAELVLIWGGFAGEVVGGHANGFHAGLTSDVKRADELVRLITGRRPGKAEAIRLNARAAKRAIAILTTNAEALKAVADLLIRDNELSGEIVRRVLSFYTPVNPRQKRVRNERKRKK